MVEKLAVEAETAITYRNKMEQIYLRYSVLMTVKHLERNLHDKKHEWLALNTIKKKTLYCQIVNSQADKRKTVVSVHGGLQLNSEQIHTSKSIYTHHTQPNQ